MARSPNSKIVSTTITPEQERALKHYARFRKVKVAVVLREWMGPFLTLIMEGNQEGDYDDD